MVIDNSRFTNVFKTRFKGVLSEFLIVDGNSRKINIENQMNKIKQQQLKTTRQILHIVCASNFTNILALHKQTNNLVIIIKYMT